MLFSKALKITSYTLETYCKHYPKAKIIPTWNHYIRKVFEKIILLFSSNIHIKRSQIKCH